MFYIPFLFDNSEFFLNFAALYPKKRIETIKITTMKKILVMVIATMMATANAMAQHEEGDNTIQPRIGLTLSTLSNMDNAKMKVNLAYGVEFEHFINDQFSVAGGLLFTDQGAKLDYSESEYTLNIYYAAFPLTANYYVLPGLALKAGLQPAYRVKTQMKEGDTKIDLDRALELLLDDDDVKMNKFELSIPVGLSYEYNGITLDARYNFGVTKAFSGLDDSVRNQVVTITLGYKF